jgi:hypothetical protein
MTASASSMPSKKISCSWINPAGYKYTVIIFDQEGQQIFSGEWTNDVYNGKIEVGKLYVYHVIQNGRQIDSGKFARNNSLIPVFV